MPFCFLSQFQSRSTCRWEMIEEILLLREYFLLSLYFWCSPNCHSHPLRNIQKCTPALTYSLFSLLNWWNWCMHGPDSLLPLPEIMFALHYSCFCSLPSWLEQVLLLLQISSCPAVPSRNVWTRPTWGRVSK